MSRRWRAQQTDEQWWATYAAAETSLRLLSMTETAASRNQPPAARGRRREYAVSVEIDLPEDQRGAWSEGPNEGFLGLVQEDGGWRVDEISSSPGFI